MNRHYIILLLTLTTILLAGCKVRHSGKIDEAYQLTSQAPDSALAILNGIKQSRLSDSEKARFALVYTMAQDKSGLDVDNDSLIAIAYTFYDNRKADSLYAKCEYYTGKYYLLNDSTEKAVECLQKSYKAAKRQGDKYTQCLALERMSYAVGQTNQQHAVSLAMLAEKIYSSLKGATPYNLVYHKLNVATALLFAGNLSAAEKKCKEAIQLAKTVKDSALISDACQDMSSIKRKQNDNSAELAYSKESYNYSRSCDYTKLLNLAWAYLNTDSISKCYETLNLLKTNDKITLYTAYYLRQIAAIKSHDYDKALVYADSSDNYIEQKYSEQIGSKEKYYKSLIKAQYEKGVSESKTELYGWIICIIIFAAALIIFLIHIYYKQYKAKAKLKLDFERKERENENRMHEQAMKQKDLQMSIMRKYILEKVSIAKKIEKIKDNTEKSILLNDKDWKEIKDLVNIIDDNFPKRLTNAYPELKEDDLNFLILVRLKFPSKAMATIYGISEKSIRQKLFIFKQKVGLDDDKETSLRNFIETF